ncbi:MAG: galactose mutarotase [Clostridia bacterium]|nr:galactose mutarotase [Clostridia bacterium]
MYSIRAEEIEAELSPLGAAVRSVKVPDRNGRMTEISLAVRDPDAGVSDPSLSGRIVAPCCGRVRDGEIRIDGQAFSLAKNEGRNHLHGGPSGASFRIWDCVRRDPDAVRFELRLPNGLDGYPGDRILSVEYRVTGRQLALSLSAVTNAVTWMGMTSHLYWDLSGRFDGTALEQELEIRADRVVFNDPSHLPVSVGPAGGPFDFSAPVRILDRMKARPDHGQLAIGRGYNNAFLLRRPSPFAARLYAPSTGIRMTLRCDEEALVFYSGGFLGNDTPLRNGHACPGCAVALEAQPIPDPFHLPGARPVLLSPSERYTRTISWSFETL